MFPEFLCFQQQPRIQQNRQQQCRTMLPYETVVVEHRFFRSTTAAAAAAVVVSDVGGGVECPRQHLTFGSTTVSGVVDTTYIGRFLGMLV